MRKRINNSPAHWPQKSDPAAAAAADLDASLLKNVCVLHTCGVGSESVLTQIETEDKLSCTEVYCLNGCLQKPHVNDDLK